VFESESEMAELLLTTSVLGIYLLFGLASGRYPFAFWKLMLAWAYAAAPLAVVLGGATLGIVDFDGNIKGIAFLLDCVVIITTLVAYIQNYGKA